MRDNVQCCGKEVPRPAQERHAWRQTFAEHHNAIPRVEGVQVEQSHYVSGGSKDILATDRVNQTHDSNVVIIEASAAKALEQVVIRPSGVHVCIHTCAVSGPHVVWIGRKVAVKQRRHAVQKVDRLVQVSLHVEGEKVRRSQ